MTHIDPLTYVKSPLFRVPDVQLIYNPIKECSFSYQGEAMVEHLLQVAPSFAKNFDTVFSPDSQRKIMYKSFYLLKQEWESQKARPEFLLQKLTEKSSSKKYFETNRNFERLVPLSYKRTKAPRLSTTGSTFHGMKKSLLLEILKDLTLREDVVFIDIDMSAAHSRIARYLLDKNDSQLDSSLKDPQFWSKQISLAKPYFNNSGISDSVIKKILKVGLYTSINGGNPASPERVVASLTLNAESYIKDNELYSLADLQESELYQATENYLRKFPLVREVQSINKTCTVNTGTYGNPDHKSYTIDKVLPYEYDSPHQGISRVLQGFEVVLLTVLVREILLTGGLPVSLDHDGVLAMYSRKRFAALDNNVNSLCETLTNGLFHAWSVYLLEENIPVEPKRLVIKGNLTEF